MNKYLVYVLGMILLLGSVGGKVHAEKPGWLAIFKGSAPYAEGFVLVDEISLNFDAHHPQGMTMVGDKLYLSSVEVINRKEEKGRGYLFEMTLKGELLRTLELGEGAMYHPSGLDFDGDSIWVSVAEYTPNSSSIIYRVEPKTMTATEVFRFDDHIGGVISVPTRGELVGVNWGSRQIYRWKVDGEGKVTNAGNPDRFSNGNHFIDYQDGQWIRGTDLVLFGGLKGYRGSGKRPRSVSVGGMALVNTATMQVVWTAPLPLYSKRGHVMTRNPLYIKGSPEGIHFYFIPDDNESVLYRYVAGHCTE